MLSGRASQYFNQRDQQDPAVAGRRKYHQLMLSITDGLVRMRKKRNLTQTELAKRMKTSQSTIGLWEAPGYDGYSLKKLYELADHLGHDLKVEFTERVSAQAEPFTITFTERAADWHLDLIRNQAKQADDKAEEWHGLALMEHFKKEK